MENVGEVLNNVSFKEEDDFEDVPGNGDFSDLSYL